jgi:hypothetical protein
VSLKFVKLLAPSLIPNIRNFYNFSIIPLPKISNPSDFSDYHPIAILPCLLKAFEVCMRGQMMEYLMLNEVLDPH